MLKFIFPILFLTLVTLPFNHATAQQALMLNIPVPAPFHTDDDEGFVDIILKEVCERMGMEVENAFRAVKTDGIYERYFQQIFTPLVQK